LLAEQLPHRVEDSLRQFFVSRAALIDSVGGGYRQAVDRLEAFVLRGGKRVRPRFAWTGWLGAGGDPTGPDAEAVLQACSALELVQAAALVHDDIIDASTTRRGFPTVHVEFTEQHRQAGWHGKAEQFGESVAILLGDLALVWADDMLHSAGLAPETVARVTPVWAAMRTEVLGGQYLDIANEVAADESVEAATRVNRFKTAAYTIERPLHIGAALAGADDDLIDAYRRFGTDIGLAFQLRDDLLGVFGDPEVTGKPAGDDLREGKRTLLLAVAVERAEQRGQHDARQAIMDAVGDPRLDEAGVERVRGLLTDLGAVQAVEQRLAALTGSALDALSAADVEEPAASQLAELAVTATRRHS